MVFPPRPHGDELLEAVVRRRLDALDGGVLEWEPVTASGLGESWVGVVAGALNPGRPWTFDVVLPSAARTLEHPLLVAVPHDVVVFTVVRPGLDVPLVLQVPFENVGGDVLVPAAAIPPPPWELSADAVWSQSAIASAVWEWCSEAGRPDVVPDGAGPDPDGSYQLDANLWVASPAFDELLDFDPRDAAMLTEIFGVLAEALR